MKKLLLATLFLTLAVFAFALDSRVCFWQLDTTDAAGILAYVDTPMNIVTGATDPDFLLAVECSAYPGEIKYSTDAVFNHPQVAWEDMGGGPMAWVYCDMQAWVNGNWTAGSTLTFTLTYLPTGESATNTMTVPENTFDPIFLLDMFPKPGLPGTWWLPESLFETPPPTYTVHMTTVPAGFIVPATLGP